MNLLPPVPESIIYDVGSLLPLVSQAAVDNEFFGHLDNWPAAARLEKAGLLSAEDADALRFWATAAADARISPDFRDICSRNHGMIQELGNGPRLLGG